MILRELKDWVNKLPEEFMEYPVMNGEYGIVDEKVFYRKDLPITTIIVDTDSNEILLLNDTDEKINDITESGSTNEENECTD